METLKSWDLSGIYTTKGYFWQGLIEDNYRNLHTSQQYVFQGFKGEFNYVPIMQRGVILSSDDTQIHWIYKLIFNIFNSIFLIFNFLYIILTQIWRSF